MARIIFITKVSITLIMLCFAFLSENGAGRYFLLFSQNSDGRKDIRKHEYQTASLHHLLVLLFCAYIKDVYVIFMIFSADIRKMNASEKPRHTGKSALKTYLFSIKKV